MSRFFIEISFDGSAYCGWQLQKNAISVQQVLTQALDMLFNQPIELTGCGRTDTGVHARKFYAHFDLNNVIDKNLDLYVYKLNGILPDDIVVKRVFQVDNEMHARFSAINRTYRYYICQEKSPFRRNYHWHVYQQLDVDLMNKAASVLVETSDFTSFAKLHSNAKNNLCKVSEAYWMKNEGELIFTITANRFLRNMVRAIVGTLVEVGKGKLTLDGYQQVIDGKNRSLAGTSVPAKGLFLYDVVYPFDIQ